MIESGKCRFDDEEMTNLMMKMMQNDGGQVYAVVLVTCSRSIETFCGHFGRIDRKKIQIEKNEIHFAERSQNTKKKKKNSSEKVPLFAI